MKTKKLITGIIFSLLSTSALALVVDRDSDGLIEINSLDDLNEIRNDPTGRTFRGSSEGCPIDGCKGFELTRDLDFDTNKNGYLDSGDWNNGRSWTPIPAPALSSLFEGNGHSISNFFNAIPAITPKENTFIFEYGLFAGEGWMSVANVRFVKPIIIVEGAMMPTNAIPYVGVVRGMGTGGWSSILYVDVIDARILISRPSMLAPLENPGVIGGVAGEFEWGMFNFVNFSGSIENNDSTKHIIGGIVGKMTETFIWMGATQGEIVTNGIAGGAVGVALNAGIHGISSNTKITASTAGGVVGSLLGSRSIISQSVTKGELLSAEGGGLIGQLNTSGSSVELKSSYSTSVVNNNGNFYVQLIGRAEPTDIILNTDSYQVVDASGIKLFAQDGAYTNPVTSSVIKCPTAQVSPECEKPNLLSSWVGSWDFGSADQFPRSRAFSNFPWFSTDKPDGSGDYEGISRLTRYVPEYTCENPSDIQVKEKKSGYVFNARLPDIFTPEGIVFEFFNAKQGLKCLDAKQANGNSCDDYQVSYLCGGSGVVPKWTDWINQDSSKNDGGDYESIPSKVCSQGQPIGIRAKAEGVAEFYGSPQIPKKFSLSKGFECDNDANGPAGKENCKDYEVRMVCII